VDREPGLGPLAGIREGLLAIRSERAYVTSTDAPWLTPRFVRALLLHEGAVAPEQDGVVQPLSAVYPKTLAAEAERRLAMGPRSAVGLLESAGLRRVSVGALPDPDSVRSLDTPEAYLEAVRRMQPGAHATLEVPGHSIPVPIGSLADLLSRFAPELCQDPGAYRVSLPGSECACDSRAPLGPGERALVTHARTSG